MPTRGNNRKSIECIACLPVHIQDFTIWLEFGNNVDAQTNNFMENMIQYNGTVNTADKSEVKYWTTKLNVSSQQLVGAIKATGSHSIAVIEEYLFQRRNRVRRPRFIAQV
jgi:hypothetical protein